MIDRLRGGQLRYSPLAPLPLGAYRWRSLRRLCVAALLRLEGGEFYSVTLRRILEKYHGGDDRMHPAPVFWGRSLSTELRPRARLDRDYHNGESW